MNKSDLVRTVSVKLNLTMEQANASVSAMFDSMKDALRTNQRVEVRGFGAFRLKDYDGRLGRNPKTGEDVVVPPRRSALFKPATDIKARLNQ